MREKRHYKQNFGRQKIHECTPSDRKLRTNLICTKKSSKGLEISSKSYL